MGGVSFELWERRRNLYRRPQLWQSLLSGPLGQSNQATSKPSAELCAFCVRHAPLPVSPITDAPSCRRAGESHTWHRNASVVKCGINASRCTQRKLSDKSENQTRVGCKHTRPRCLSVVVVARHCIKWDEDS